MLSLREFACGKAKQSTNPKRIDCHENSLRSFSRNDGLRFNGLKKDSTFGKSQTKQKLLQGFALRAGFIFFVDCFGESAIRPRNDESIDSAFKTTEGFSVWLSWFLANFGCETRLIVCERPKFAKSAECNSKDKLRESQV